MNNRNFLEKLIILCSVVLVFPVSALAQIEAVECYTSKGTAVAPGGTWRENYNGVEYECTCRKSGGPDCVPISSSSSSNSNSGSGDFNQQMVQSVVAPLIQGLFDWIFTPSTDNSSSSSNTVYTSPPPTEEEIRLFKEKQEKWKEQVQKVKAEYTQIVNEKFSDQQKNTVNDFKNRVAKSEAIKNIKQLNCASYQSIEAAKIVLQGKDNFKDLEGSLENMRSLSDFTDLKLPDCPEIKYEIPEVTVSNPVSFQQMLYQTIKYKADSITVNVALLKEKEKNIQKVLEEKKQIVEAIKLQPPAKDNKSDQLLKDALDALNEALEEDKKVNEEITNNQKSIEVLEKIRSTYDLDQSQK